MSYVIRRAIRVGEKTYEMQSTDANSMHWRNFDARIYNNLALSTNKSVPSDDNVDSDYQLHVKNGANVLNIYPYATYASYAGDYYETPEAIQERIAELNAIIDDTDNSQAVRDEAKLNRDEYKKRYIAIVNFLEDASTKMDFIAPHSLVHPYAIVKFAGMHGNANAVNGSYLFDSFMTRRWYEVDGDNISSYAKTPTTTKIISWGSEDPIGRTPYSFQDFVFCKDWNIIPNNRMITLRRYFAPVTDNIEFDNYKEYEDESVLLEDNTVKAKQPIEKTNSPFAPLATAVTYFGEGTGNELSNILNFSAKYNWKQIKAESSPITIDAQANDMGEGLIGEGGHGILSGAMKAMSIMTGFTRALDGKLNPMNNAANAVPPDPYNNGPYENRILGPVNVIMDTIKRERGLIFEHNNLKIKFSYVSRPIAGINNKAVLLDLLANILVMCYANGSWFGGLERFRSSNRTTYPFTAGKVMNRLYKGQLFGKNGAIRLTASQAWDQTTHGLGDMLSEAMKDMKNLVSAMWNQLMSVVKGLTGNQQESDNRRERAKAHYEAALGGKFVGGFQSVIAAKVLRGATIPWVTGKKALLTGDPVGEWHLTIGNPLNPIAMIGNLVCDGVSIKWSDELGPDDFPIGFEAEVTLKHALGRDREAIESMFNRGYGRIYSLPTNFRTSADFETKVDSYTGGDAAHDALGRMKYDEWSSTYFGGGGAGITDIETGKLYNSGGTYPGLMEYKSLTATKYGGVGNYFRNPVHIVTPFQMQWVL